MKYALISDIHSNVPALEAVLADIEKLKAQRENERHERMKAPKREAEIPVDSESFFKRV
jgi:hypothetical protein